MAHSLRGGGLFMGLFIPYPPQERLQVRRTTGAPDTPLPLTASCVARQPRVCATVRHWKTLTWFRCVALNDLAVAFSPALGNVRLKVFT